MTNKIGFYCDDNNEVNENIETIAVEKPEMKARKSLVSVRFEKNNRVLSYYNDKFDLHKGDIVFVDGKLEGERGFVEEVNYNFKIKLSDYKKVVALADTTVKGEFFFAGDYFISFDESVIPYEKVITWLKPPVVDEEEIVVSGEDEEGFLLEKDISELKVPYNVKEKGIDYYLDGRVIYLSVAGNMGKAIVDGTNIYEIEFTYKNGEVSNFICDCYCNYACKHIVAVIMQLKNIVKTIEENYKEQYQDYFSAVTSYELFKVTRSYGKKVVLILINSFINFIISDTLKSLTNK